MSRLSSLLSSSSSLLSSDLAKNDMSFQKLDDPRYEIIRSKIHVIIHEDTMYQKGNLPMRTQKCFAVRVGIMLDLP
jgi:hypothetical protein